MQGNSPKYYTRQVESLSGARDGEQKNKIFRNSLFSTFSNSFASMLQKRDDHKTQHESKEQN